MKILNLTDEEKEDLLKEIIKRTKFEYEDIGVTGSTLYGCARETPDDRPINFTFEGHEGILYPSDIDVLVWCKDIEKWETKNDVKFMWKNLKVHIKFEPVSIKYSKFWGLFTLPIYSLITKEVFNFNEEDLKAYFDYRTKPPSRWAVGRKFDDLINNIKYEVK